MIVTVSSIGT